MSYEEYFSAEDVATYRRVKRGSMRLAAVSREVLAEMLGGRIAEVGKEFVITRHGNYRVANGSNADNTTEQAALAWFGADVLNTSDDEALGRVLELHGWDAHTGIVTFRNGVRARLHQDVAA